MNEDDTLWICYLSNGEKITQDDSNKYEIFSGWRRLKKYVESNNLTIQKLELVFRSNSLVVFDDLEKCNGVFFKKSLLGGFGRRGLRQVKLNQKFFYILGKVKDQIEYKEINIPALIVTSEGFRKIDGEEESIIWHKSQPH